MSELLLRSAFGLAQQGYCPRSCPALTCPALPCPGNLLDYVHPALVPTALALHTALALPRLLLLQPAPSPTFLHSISG